MKNTKYDVNFCESLSDIIEDAANYSVEILDLYQSLGVHKRSQATKLYDSLSKFTKHSNISVFEFFRRFSAGVGSPVKINILELLLWGCPYKSVNCLYFVVQS